jgi:hypothetical protein
MSENDSQPKRPKPHHIEVRRRPGSEGTIQTGASTLIFLDGKPLGGAYFFKFEVNAKKLAKVMIELYATVDIDADVYLDRTVEETDMTINGKPVAIHTLSSYSPVAIAVKKES